MGLLQKAVETYDAHSDIVGKYIEGHEVLAPVSHMIIRADIEITLDPEGNFVSAAVRGKNEPKIVIPVTEKSASRTSKGAAERPHPLSDKLSYYINKPEIYISQLSDWIESKYTHPKLPIIRNYVETGKMVDDLVRVGIVKLGEDGRPLKKYADMIICWRINGEGECSACWEDKALIDAFIKYYSKYKSDTKKDLCMISGNDSVIAATHAKGIIPFNGNAKLISANDKDGYTYRGRFSEDWQASTVSYESSQKAHNALRWLVANQGVETPQVFGGRTFLCWNPQGIQVCVPTGPFRKRCSAIRSPSEYKSDLKKTLLGYKTNMPEQAGVVIAAFDAATSGRLALTYYNELMGSDFLDRLYVWDEQCSWFNGKFGIESPLLYRIINCAYGTQRKKGEKCFLETDDKVLGQQMQRLVHCRVDRAKIPYELTRRLTDRASSPQCYEPYIWRECVFVTCAVLNKYLIDSKEENIMSWELDKNDRSFQFGRLLAAMEKVEEDYYWDTKENKKEVRQTNAIKYLSEFHKKPWTTYVRVHEHLERAYIPRVTQKQKERYDRLRQEIILILKNFPEEELNRPLDDIYLMGYDLQRNVFFNSDSQHDNEEE